ncbi:branched-chain amino acid ABC transporter permease [Marinilactibacillus sp. 15R]|uniref:Amino acid/amide ABC transporter membrane protein 1, HAAT family n=1 Tax=Marinilactibacillus piezotolerans TaxID=258723 RepID=A0A1I3YC80_9LACT|nr:MULTISPECIES: branched-chain amino acid ABC transporter permease [Marinilactibacillus]API88464.1 branched-chain amino acid ABC transporter permease [Marinilactibacillus sp. 15R]SFK28806.1 amino acid/amide ABC transporter membrane protein 1, HAAT family [Marinilactibacillus piezotolerans]
MSSFMQQVINGLSLGSIYALIALGYTMVYGIIKLINFAHGEIFMIGAFVGYATIQFLNVGLIPALLVAMTASALLGVIIERVAYRPLRKSSRITALITAIGVSYLIQNGMIQWVGPNVRSFPQVLTNTRYDLGFFSISRIQLIIFGTSIILMIALQLIVHQTKMGKAMRAVSMDPEAAQLMGINVNHVISFTFMLGSALAGAGGVLVGLFYNTINPTMGFLPGLKAFIAAVLGGIGIIPGAMLGGILIGLTETMVVAYGNSLLRDAVVFVILILILLVRPSGILGKTTKEKV